MRIDGRKLDHKALEHLRILAVKRVIKRGERPSEVAASMGFCRTTIYPWLRQYRKQGEKSLTSSKSLGPKKKISNKQAIQIKCWIIGKDPRQYGLDFGLWTRKIIQEMIHKKMGVYLCLASVGQLLTSLHITPQKPLRRAYERDPKKIKQWVENDYPEIKSRAKKRKAEIFFLDEAGFSSEPNLGRTYGLKGQTPIVKTTGKRQRINAISAVSPRGGFWSKVYSGNFNATRFIGFLKDFMRPRKTKVILIVDGHPSHRAKCVAHYVQSLRGKLEIFFLPPHAPDLNPDEFVWQHVKTNGVCKKPLHQNESLKNRVRADLTVKGVPKVKQGAVENRDTLVVYSLI